MRVPWPEDGPKDRPHDHLAPLTGRVPRQAEFPVRGTREGAREPGSPSGGRGNQVPLANRATKWPGDGP